MTRYHLTVTNSDGQIVGQYDVSSEARRSHIHDNLPGDLDINERTVPDKADLGQSLSKLSGNVVDWDPRLENL